MREKPTAGLRMCIGIPSTVYASVTPGGLEFGPWPTPFHGDEVVLSVRSRA
jgi:hypothetical protein